MLSIVDTFSKRIVHILKILAEEQDWITIKDIARKLKVSEKTVNDDLNLIKKEFNHKIIIESSISKGIRIEDFPVNLFLELQSSILRESVSIKFIIELLKHPGMDLNYYSENIHVSRSTLYRQLPIINKFFNAYGIHIESNRSFYNLIAEDEYICRRFFTTFLFEVYQYKTFPFIDNSWNNFYKNRIPYIYHQNNEHISDLQLSYYSVYYHFSILREKTGNHLPRIDDSLGKDVNFSSDQINFLKANNVLPYDTLLDIESSIYIHRHTLFAKTDDLFITTTTEFIETVYTIFNLDYQSDTQKLLIDFLIDLCINAKYFQVPYHFFYDRFSSFSQQINHAHPVIFDTLIRLITDYSNKLALDFSIYNCHLIYLFVVTLPSILEANFNKSVLIISNYSREHSLFMARTIQKQLSFNPINFDEIICTHVDDLEQYDLTHFDLIISNTHITYKETPCILINDFPNKKNIGDIQNFLASNTSLKPEVS